MNSPRIYIVIPRTVDSKEPPYKVCMSCGRMAAHAAHAGGLLAKHNVDVDGLDLIVLQVASSVELDEIRTKLMDSSVDFLEYRDRDDAFFGELLTALAVFPIEKGSCIALNGLKPWRCACNN